jgi:hypothetical protein
MALESIRERIRNKVDNIRQQRQETQKIQRKIQQSASAAAIKERKKQAIRVAVEREIVSADRQIQSIRKPSASMSMFGGGAMGAFTQPVNVPAAGFNSITGQTFSRPSSKKSKTTRFVKIKGTNRFKRVRVKSKGLARVSQPQRFDVIGGGYGRF